MGSTRIGRPLAAAGGALLAMILVGCSQGGQSPADAGGDGQPWSPSDAPDVAPDLPPDLAEVLPTDVPEPPPKDAADDGAGGSDAVLPPDAGQDGETATDAIASDALCAGIVNAEDPRGCTGMNACDQTHQCVPRLKVFEVKPVAPSSVGSPGAIIAGPDGNIWFGDGSGISRLTPSSGELARFPGNFPRGFALGADGNLWFTDGTSVNRITLDGHLTAFLFDTNIAAEPVGLALGSDGNLWFGGRIGRIGRITPKAVVTLLPMQPEGYYPWVAAGVDGNLWYTGETTGRIVRVTPAGAVTEFPTGIDPAVHPFDQILGRIVAGAEGNLWFVEYAGQRIGRMDTSGKVAFFPLPNPINILTAGPAGNVWFVRSDSSALGRIAPDGGVTEFPISVGTVRHVINGLTVDAKGALWFTAEPSERIYGAFPCRVGRYIP